MTTYSETIYVNDRHVTVTAETPPQLDSAITWARDHWGTDAAAQLPDTETPEPWPWPTPGSEATPR